ncbi:MAG: endonuclease/exonuclease/phosphatase family protein [Myxococcales bacterium]|nr:endonuclease/exonuclease/phosphatase family protein [Myxococcales bacterium]
MDLRLLTWNLNGLDGAHLDERTEAACLAMLLRTDPPHVVLLQEVVRRSWHAHIKHHFKAAGYRSVPADPTRTDSEYFCVVMVHTALGGDEGGVEPFAGSFMGRARVWARIDLPEGPQLLVATSHLESGKQASIERVRQLQRVISAMNAHAGPAVFGGDTNLRVAEEPKVEDLPSVVDAWQASGADPELRATWPAVRTSRPGARFDRVLCTGLEVTRFALMGHSAPTLGEPPSDHLGIEVTVRVATQEAEE